MAFSDRCGGTLTLPSPTHVHHVDMSAAVRSLRRSLSRSPSKFNLRSPEPSLAGAGGAAGRGSTTTPPSPGRSRTESPQTSGPTSPHRFPNFSAQSNPLSTPSRSGVKLSVRSARPRSTAKTFCRTRPSPKSPLKRVFGAVPDTTLNLPPPSTSGHEGQGQENSFINFALNLGDSVSRRNLEKPSRHSLHLDVSCTSKPSRHSLHLDVSGSSKLNMAKSAGVNDTFAISASPLKRNDTTMNTDSSSTGSPVAKRRSLHGIGSLTTGADFDMTKGENFISTLDASDEDQDGVENQHRGALLPKRTASLRKSTRQQRPSNSGLSGFSRSSGEKQAARMLGNEPSTPIYNSRPRLSTDSWAPLPDDRGSPFPAPLALPNASIHVMPRIYNTQLPQQPHPLSQTLTQSSSGPSVPSESPTRIPVASWARPTSGSQSLPRGAQPPSEDGQAVETPAYREARPFQGTFVSTGLVSKMYRHPETALQHAVVMPDTPCKKSYPNATFPPPTGVFSGGRRMPARAGIDVPATPMAPALARARGGQVFRSVRSRASRRGDEGEDPPPTPTKTLFPRVPGKPLALTPLTSRIEAAPSFGYQVSPAKGNTAQTSPVTPQGAMLPPQPSRILVPKAHEVEANGTTMPATPTTHDREDSAVLASGRVTPQNLFRPKDVDECLMATFGRAEVIGKGEFSSVYRVTENASRPTTSFGSSPFGSSTSSSSGQVFAVKRIKLPIGMKARNAKYREAHIMQALTGHQRVVQYRDHWDADGYLYIKMDFYEEGSLDKFLDFVGFKGRMDDFRLWKILIDLSQGLQAIHDAGFIHLDLKPANVMIDFKGYLKIGDFGMATTWPAPKDMDGEGDREYMGPEILQGYYDKAADVYALGMILFEAAVNIQLPENGPTWQALRNDGLAELALLTSKENQSKPRDAHGLPVDMEVKSSSFEDALTKPVAFGGRRTYDMPGRGIYRRNLFGNSTRDHLQNPPRFMWDENHASSLDTVARCMLNSNPARRPTAKELLEVEAVQWVQGRRNAGAVVFEGNYGPLVDESGDTEMTDV